MAKSKNPQKWHPHNSGWTSLFFGRFDFKHFGIFLVKFWRKEIKCQKKVALVGHCESTLSRLFAAAIQKAPTEKVDEKEE